MKAIATLAVLGLAYAGERRENPRFRIDTKTLTANNNKDVINIDFSKDITNIPGVKSSVVTRDLKDILPGGLRDLIKDVKVDHRVFTAQNNTGVITINMDDADNELARFRSVDSRTGEPIFFNFPDLSRKDDADNELIGVTWKNKDINGSHNSGRMDININNDDADNELYTRKPKVTEDPAEIELRKWTHAHQTDDADNELRSTTQVHANDNRGMMQIMGQDDELFLDLHNTHTHVNADHNSGMMNVNIHNDDADNELASWRTDNTYYFPQNQGKPDYVHVKTENTVNTFAGNTGVRIIQRDDADNELAAKFGIDQLKRDRLRYPQSWEIQGYFPEIEHDDADNELVYSPIFDSNGRVIPEYHKPGFMYVMDDADNELRSTTKVHANDNNGMMNIMGHDDELFLDLTNKHTHVNANHNSGMMNVNIHNDDADNELVQLGALLKSLKDRQIN